MGLLVPADFDLRTIENGDEREVVRRLVDGLTDGWLIFPNVTFHSDRPHEIDAVLLHEEQGVVHLEVKGHRVYVQAGEWYGRQGKMKPQPFSQAKAKRVLPDPAPPVTATRRLASSLSSARTCDAHRASIR